MTMSLYDIYDWASLLAGTSSACLGHSQWFLGYIIHAQSWEKLTAIYLLRHIVLHRYLILKIIIKWRYYIKVHLDIISDLLENPSLWGAFRFMAFYLKNLSSVSTTLARTVLSAFVSFVDLFVRFRKQVQCTTGLVERVFQTLLHSTIAHRDLHGRKIRPMEFPSTLFRVILVNRDVASPRGENCNSRTRLPLQDVSFLYPRANSSLISMFLWNMH
jgi:hypothetical protein